MRTGILHMGRCPPEQHYLADRIATSTPASECCEWGRRPMCQAGFGELWAIL